MRSISMASGALLLSRSDVERLLTPDKCIAAVEDAFRQHALGQAPSPGILGMHATEGGFHVKAGVLELGRSYFAAKLNANFPSNPARHGLPTIQGVLVLFDAVKGVPLAVMDSMALTALRTAAATAVAAKYLARAQCETALICGCGGQARAQVRALQCVRSVTQILAYDQDSEKGGVFASAMESETGVRSRPVEDLGDAVSASDIVITCTTAHRFFVTRNMVQPGTFVAGVGADNEDKQELDPELLAHSTVVVDLLDQCVSIGDLHHALAAKVMARSDVHAELGEVIAGIKPGRDSDEQVIVFDSTGTALQDVAAAATVYSLAVERADGTSFRFDA